MFSVIVYVNDESVPNLTIWTKLHSSIAVSFGCGSWTLTCQLALPPNLSHTRFQDVIILLVGAWKLVCLI